MCGRREVGEGTSDHSNFGCMLVALVMRIVLFVSVFSVQPCHYERLKLKMMAGANLLLSSTTTCLHLY